RRGDLEPVRLRAHQADHAAQAPAKKRTRAERSVGRDRRQGFHLDRAASVPLPTGTSGRQRNFSKNGLDLPSAASAMISPSTGANLNPCPQSPAAMTNPSRSGSRAIQKCPSFVSQYKHIRVQTIGASTSAGNVPDRNSRKSFSSSGVTA